MAKKILGEEPSSAMTKRGEIAKSILAGLLPLSGNTIVIDSQKSIHWWVRQAYRYADELLKYEGVHSDDIIDSPPEFPPYLKPNKDPRIIN